MLTVFIRNKEQQSIIKYKTCTWYGHPEQSQFSILTYGNVIVFFNVDNYILILHGSQIPTYTVLFFDVTEELNISAINHTFSHPFNSKIKIYRIE